MKIGPVAAIWAGWEAFQRVPGLWRHMIVGLCVNYAVFAALAAGAYYGLYLVLFKPASIYLLEFQAARVAWVRILATIAGPLLWLTQGVLVIACVLLGFLIAVQLISVWTDGLAARVVRHFRGTPPADAQSVGLLPEARRTVRTSVNHGALGMLAFLCVFVPVAGPLVTFAIFAYLLGWEMREPYLLAREAWGEHPDALRRRSVGWTMLLGLAPALVGVLPVVGWLVLPFVLVLGATGVAWAGEMAHRAPGPGVTVTGTR